jgi:hypothetical protein
MKTIKNLVNKCDDEYICTLSVSLAILISILCGMGLAKIGLIMISHPLMGIFYTLFVIASVVTLAIVLSGVIASIIDGLKDQ